MISLTRMRDVLRASFWLVPAVCSIAAIGLAIGLVALDQNLSRTQNIILFPGPPDGARGFLSSIVQAMIAFTGMVFSITIVVLQLSSAQFSPRVLRMFLGDRTIQLAFGVFVATFVYGMTVLRAVEGTSNADGFVPRIAVTTASLFVLASVGLFIRYISHVANLIRVATVVAYIGEQSREVLDKRYLDGNTDRTFATHADARAALVVSAPRHGVLVSVNAGGLVDLAARHRVVVELVHCVGDFVPKDAPLARVHVAGDPRDVDSAELADRVARNVALDIERTMEQDLAFGLRQLVDIAERALSPGVNDPTTAAQALDVVHDLLRRLATRPDPRQCWADDEGEIRLVIPPQRFPALLDFVVREIWHYGHDAAQVPERLRLMLADLHEAALPAYLPAIDACQRHVAPSTSAA